MKILFVSITFIVVFFIFIVLLIPMNKMPLTELYFKNPESLRKHIFSNKTYSFSFIVHNLEYKNMKYFYSVDILFNNTLHNLDNGFILLKHNESKEIKENYKLKKGFERAKINIKLIKIKSKEHALFENLLWWYPKDYPMKLNIHFWVNEIKPIQIKKI